MFFCLIKGDQTRQGEECSESEVMVKLKIMFSLKLGLLLEKVVQMYLIWIVLNERQRSHGLKIQAQTFARVPSLHSIKLSYFFSPHEKNP